MFRCLRHFNRLYYVWLEVTKKASEKRMNDEPVIANPWHGLRQFTSARIALGRAGISLPTAPQLALQMAHANARDAVHQALDAPGLLQALEDGLALCDGQILTSAASNRPTYLQRPDLGRRLDEASRARLVASAGANSPVDLALVLADGLSALALETQALPFLHALLPRLVASRISIAPLMLVQQGRVAIGDEIGQLLAARVVVVLIGERPGLSSPDSMGCYLTFAPRVGLSDESRNCISNVRCGGLVHEYAAHKLHYLLLEAMRRQLSGVELKDESAEAQINADRINFLLE
jgi:ethanolamine ammonia-lyase small subunit